MAFDEDYWQPSFRISNDHRARVFTDQDIPAGFLFVSKAKLSQEPVEVVTGSTSNVRSTQETVEVIAGSASNVRLTQGPVEVIAASPRIVEDEYWINPVAPVPWKLYQRLPLGDPEELPAGALLVSPSVDEYYWQNPVRPVAASMYRSPVFLDPDEVPFPVLSWIKMTQGPIEVISGYRYNPYVGWQGTSMSVS
jgi:hypothetical protein